MMKEELEAQLLTKRPDDGWCVNGVMLNREYYLRIMIRHGGEVSTPVGCSGDMLIWNCRGDELYEHVYHLSAFDCGRRDRLTRLADAVCDYFNTGGSFTDAAGLFTAARHTMARSVVNVIQEGYRLVAISENDEGVAERLFIHSLSGWAIRWVAGGFFDVLQAADLEAEQLERERTVAVANVRTGDAGPEGSGASLRLTGDSGSPEKPA